MQQPARIFAPRLTLHIEAETISELMDALDQVMGSLNADLIGGAAMAQDAPKVSVDLYASKPEADAAAAASRPRGRPRKSDAKPSDPAIVTTSDAAPAAQAEDKDDTCAPSAPAAPVASAEAAPDHSTMQALSPAEARAKGIEMATGHFARNPACLPQIQQISVKYGVSYFADIPDDKAHAFLADVTLLVNGAEAA